MFKLLIGIMFCFSVLAVAQSPSPVPSVSPALGSAVSAVNGAASKVPSSIPAGVLVALAFVASELAAHGIPTSKPLSWFLGLSALLSAVILLLQKVQGLLQTLGNSLQNTSSS